MKMWNWNKKGKLSLPLQRGLLWKDRSGATLTELIAGLAVLAAVAIFGGGLLLFAERSFAETSRQSVELRKLELAGDLICKEITYADDIRISYDKDTGQQYPHVLYFSGNGSITADGNPVLMQEGRLGYYASIKSHKWDQNDSLLELSLLTQDDKNETLYSHNIMVKLVNLDLYSHSRASASDADERTESYDSRDRDVFLYYR